MVTRRTATQPVGSSENRAIYSHAWVTHTFKLIHMGYQRLDAAAHRSSEETDITGELVRAVKEAMVDPLAPRWVVHYHVGEEEPVNLEGLLGKRRPRVDIEFERVQRGPRPRFRFEAKRLHDGSSVGKYFGKDGLGCFLTGTYARDQNVAGMLGYVQTGDEATWAGKLSARISGETNVYRVSRDTTWEHDTVIVELQHTYRTRHNRQSPLDDITIYHVLLRFL